MRNESLRKYELESKIDRLKKNIFDLNLVVKNTWSIRNELNNYKSNGLNDEISDPREMISSLDEVHDYLIKAQNSIDEAIELFEEIEK